MRTRKQQHTKNRERVAWKETENWENHWNLCECDPLPTRSTAVGWSDSMGGYLSNSNEGKCCLFLWSALVSFFVCFLFETYSYQSFSYWSLSWTSRFALLSSIVFFMVFICILCIYFILCVCVCSVGGGRLESWLSKKGCLLLLQRTQVRLPASMWWLRNINNSNSRGHDTFSQPLQVSRPAFIHIKWNK